MQRNESMFYRGMIEKHQEGFEDEFTDRKWNASETKQDDTCRSCLFYRHAILSVAAGRWKAIVSAPFSFQFESSRTVSPDTVG
jgi:hypothetical protein